MATPGGTGRMAAPRKLTADLQDRICELIRAGVPIDVASRALGISETTYHAWRERGKKKGRANKPHRDFLAATDTARAESEANLVAQITRQTKTSWRAAAWLLEHRHPERWVPEKPATDDGDGDGEQEASAPADPIAKARDELAKRRAARAA